MEKEKPDFIWSICGHQNIVNFLQQSIKNKNLAHAYLFVGSNSVGKEAVAKEFMASVFCETKDGHIPCGECPHCSQIKRGLHPDVYFVEKTVDEKTGKAKKDIVIEQIRDLKNRLSQGTLMNSYKVALIPEVQHLNISAANALLKVLEEPTPKTILILIADNINSLPKTIMSRCQVIKFLPVPEKEIENYLIKECSAFPEEAKKLARLALGRPGSAISFFKNKESLADYQENIRRLFELFSKSIGERFDLIDELIDFETDETLNREKLSAVFSGWQAALRDILLIKSDNEPVVANLDFLPASKKAADQLSFKRLKNILNLIDQAKVFFRQNVNSKSVLENLIINL
ncbi:MAG: DNA polymerase III subunit delta' [Patescibacteria group bacterium]